MIDGFGWFPDAKYRRTLLLFRRLHYVFPRTTPGVSIPPWVYRQPDCDIVQPDSTHDDVERRIAVARADAGDTAFMALVSAMPHRDLRIAGEITFADRELSAADRCAFTEAPELAVSFIAEKLLDYCATHAVVPVVGQEYAAKILARKARQRLVSSASADVLLSPRQATALHAVAAGLSFGFVSDEDLARTSVENIVRFKETHSDLLDKHHRQLIAVIQKFSELSGDEGRFGEEIITLRRTALADRQRMEDDAKDAWRTAGLELTEKAIIAAGAGIVTAIGLIGTSSVHAVAAATVPTVLGAAAYAAAKAMRAVASTRKVRSTYVSYLLGAQELVTAVDGFDHFGPLM